MATHDGLSSVRKEGDDLLVSLPKTSFIRCKIRPTTLVDGMLWIAKIKSRGELCLDSLKINKADCASAQNRKNVTLK